MRRKRHKLAGGGKILENLKMGQIWDFRRQSFTPFFSLFCRNLVGFGHFRSKKIEISKIWADPTNWRGLGKPLKNFEKNQKPQNFNVLNISVFNQLFPAR